MTKKQRQVLYAALSTVGIVSLIATVVSLWGPPGLMLLIVSIGIFTIMMIFFDA